LGIPAKPWVSRGGDKLDALLEAWGVSVKNLVVVDAGSSTGGFTHCLLYRGARLVHAIDVGYNQLDWRLRNLPQVVVHERTNIMGLDALDPPADLAVADLSFRTIVAPAGRILSLCAQKVLYGLIKPQFEWRYASNQDFDGIVEIGQHKSILVDLAQRLAREKLAIQRIIPCALKGSHGNQEYFAEITPALIDPQQSNLAIIETLDLPTISFD
jgi:23S rRNA (cytidine1920-2'-O)/16S rRNA (cytidine1409-2'-O)-methyltransferase